ncbi:hypothetical protein BH09ACT7_BH09ACT7_08870 [soil metagenome]
MWDIEVNIAGYRFTSQVPDHRRSVLRLAAIRPTWWPSAQLKQPPRPHAA